MIELIAHRLHNVITHLQKSDPLLLLPEKHRSIYEPSFAMDQGRSIFVPDQNTYPYIARRILADYCVVAGLSRNEIAELAHLKKQSAGLKRQIILGDMGCGRGNAIKPFFGDTFIKVNGIDTRVTPIQSSNITIMKGDFSDPLSEFWYEKYDYLFCVLTAQHLKIDLNQLIQLMKRGLSNVGKAYLVVPLEQKERDGLEFVFNPKTIKESGIKIVAPTVDPVVNIRCVSIKFRK